MKLLPQQPGRCPFDPFYEFVYSKSWVDVYQQMDVVRHHLDFNYIGLLFMLNGTSKLL